MQSVDKTRAEVPLHGDAASIQKQNKTRVFLRNYRSGLQWWVLISMGRWQTSIRIRVGRKRRRGDGQEEPNGRKKRITLMFTRREVGIKEMEKRLTTSASTHVDEKTRQVQTSSRKRCSLTMSGSANNNNTSAPAARQKKSNEGYRATSLASTAQIGCSSVRVRIRTGQKKRREREREEV